MIEVREITAPAFWASYFINGDRSSLSEAEKDQADRWLARECIGRDDFVDCGEPHFTWSMHVYAPEMECRGGEVATYTYHDRGAAS